MKFEKVGKKIPFQKPKSGILYTPTEFVRCLIENGNSQDRHFVIKLVINIRIITINDFCVVLRHIQKYRKGSLLL